MPGRRHYTISVHLGEHDADRWTHATATLRAGDQDHDVIRAGGAAFQHPEQIQLPQAGDDLAVASALHALASSLERSAHAATRRPGELRGPCA